MIISRTPYRISFFGGGTDYPAWSDAHEGAVLAATINRYCYISCRFLPPFFQHKNRIVYSQIEMTSDIGEINHPAVRECLRFMNITEGVEIHHDGDLPKQTGLGTSSSFTVGLLNALHAIRGEMAPPMQLAIEAIHVERDLCGDNVGSQDQIMAAHGGVNCVKFLPGGVMSVSPITVSHERIALLQRRLMLFYTGVSRISSEVAAEQIRNTPMKEKELLAMREMVKEGIRILSGKQSLNPFGELLNESWKLKRTLSSRISNDEIDTAYEKALRAGAVGGKLCGAGGGGFLMLFAEPDRQPAVKAALPDYLHVPFEFERLGSQIIFFQQ